MANSINASSKGLSSAELSVIDSMIAHMQETGQSELTSFWDSIVSVAEDAISALANSDVVTQIADAATDAVTSVSKNVVSAVAANAETALTAALSDAVEAALIGAQAEAGVDQIIPKMNALGLNGRLTLDNLVKIRNMYS